MKRLLPNLFLPSKEGILLNWSIICAIKKQNSRIMRKLIAILSILAFGSLTLTAQIKESFKAMSEGNKNALVLEVSDADEKLISDTWKSFARDDFKGRVKYDRKTKQWMADDAKILSIGKGNTVDLYSKVSQKGSDCDFILWIDMGGAYCSSNAHPDSYEAAEEMMMRFGIAIQKAKVQLELDEQQKQLKKLEGELKKLVSANEKYHKTIEKAKEAIEKAEADIVENLSAQEVSQKNIELQKEVVEEVRKRLNKI